MRKHGKVDSNQTDIVKALRGVGAVPISLSSVGSGVPDLLVGFRGHNYLLEVKRNGKAELTPDQIKFHAKWFGQISRCESPEEALRIIGAIK